MRMRGSEVCRLVRVGDDDKLHPSTTAPTSFLRATTDSRTATISKLMADCLFCKIIKKEIPSFTVLDNASFYGFLDIGPLSRGHALVIPKAHAVKVRRDVLQLPRVVVVGVLVTYSSFVVLVVVVVILLCCRLHLSDFVSFFLV